MALEAGHFRSMGPARQRVRVRFPGEESAPARAPVIERVNSVVSDSGARLRVTGVMMLGFTSVVAALSAM